MTGTGQEYGGEDGGDEDGRAGEEPGADAGGAAQFVAQRAQRAGSGADGNGRREGDATSVAVRVGRAAVGRAAPGGQVGLSSVSAGGPASPVARIPADSRAVLSDRVFSRTPEGATGSSFALGPMSPVSSASWWTRMSCRKAVSPTSAQVLPYTLRRLPSSRTTSIERRAVRASLVRWAARRAACGLRTATRGAAGCGRSARPPGRRRAVPARE